MLTVNFEKCTGCGACIQSCPKQCISWITKEFGFYYPQIDEEICVNCGLCEKVCRGIPKSDLPRIFEKGFTGQNGRTGKNSTGIGLYLCKRLCDQLGIGLTAYSENRGTTISLIFQMNDFITPCGTTSSDTNRLNSRRGGY